VTGEHRLRAQRSELPGPERRDRDVKLCPQCGSVLVVTDEAEVCRAPRCEYLVLLQWCGVCGAGLRSRYGQPRAAWWRLRPVDGTGSVTVCSVTCLMLVGNKLSADGLIAVDPMARGGTT
jgi:hypothetical protein